VTGSRRGRQAAHRRIGCPSSGGVVKKTGGQEGKGSRGIITGRKLSSLNCKLMNFVMKGPTGESGTGGKWLRGGAGGPVTTAHRQGA